MGLVIHQLQLFFGATLFSPHFAGVCVVKIMQISPTSHTHPCTSFTWVKMQIIHSTHEPSAHLVRTIFLELIIIFQLLPEDQWFWGLEAGNCESNWSNHTQMRVKQKKGKQKKQNTRKRTKIVIILCDDMKERPSGKQKAK